MRTCGAQKVSPKRTNDNTLAVRVHSTLSMQKQHVASEINNLLYTTASTTLMS